MGCCKRCFARIFRFSFFFLALAIIPGIPPNTTFEHAAYDVPRSQSLDGVLALNTLLDKSERLFEGEMIGPEHLLYHNGAIYTGIHGGELIKIVGNRFEHVAKFGKPCAGIVEEQKCGRILGLAIDTVEKNSLIVVDTYYGIYHYNLDTRKERLLVAPETVLDGEKPRRARMMNSVVVAKNGDFYWTDSSSDFPIVDGVHILLANPHGRLFHYDRQTGRNRVLADRINFANGIALSPREDFIIVAATGSALLHKYHLAGAKKGQFETFIDGLPGMPDNLTPDTDGIWVPLVVAIDEDHPALTVTISRTPWLRKFLQRFLNMIESPFKLIEKYYPNPYTAMVVHEIGSLNLPILYPARTTVLRVSWDGKIVKAYHGSDSTAKGVSHVEQVGEYLYFGSPFSPFLGRKHLPGDVPKQAAQQQQTTQKPTTTTTTTPKPTTTTTTTPKPTTTTTTTPKPTTTTTTTPKPTTTTTTTPKPTTTTTTTPKPAPSTTTTTTTPKPQTQAPTQKPTTQKPTTPPPLFEDDEPIEEVDYETSEETSTQAPPAKPTPKPAPIREERDDIPPPPQPPLKVIKKGGEQGEL